MKLLILALAGLLAVRPLLAASDSHADAHAAPAAHEAPATASPAETNAPAAETAHPAEPAKPAAVENAHPTPPAAPAAHGSTHTEPAAASPAIEKQHAITAAEITSLLKIGADKSEKLDWESARLAYTQVLAAGRAATAENIRDALLGLARVYRGDGRLTKACAVYERYIKDNPGDTRLPIVYLELGRCQRALGAHRIAIMRFYSVLNTTLKLPNDSAETYRQLARTAQFEIAETYFQSGDYEQAWRFYSRLRLLDLAPADRARAAFKSAYALNLKGDQEQAVTQFRSYLSAYPQNEDAPEARHLLSLSLRRLGRSQESLAAALDLLKTEQARASADPKAWAYWQRKTGNQLANEFYEQGEISTALTLYQCLRDLGGTPEWLMPVHYQIGLCQERLNQPGLARSTYQGILDSLKTAPADSGKTSLVLQDLSKMVTWRLQHLDWVESTEKRLLLFTKPGATPSVASQP